MRYILATVIVIWSGLVYAQQPSDQVRLSPHEQALIGKLNEEFNLELQLRTDAISAQEKTELLTRRVETLTKELADLKAKSKPAEEAPPK